VPERLGFQMAEGISREGKQEANERDFQPHACRQGAGCGKNLEGARRVLIAGNG
jgi:hypothetical protein